LLYQFAEMTYKAPIPAIGEAYLVLNKKKRDTEAPLSVLNGLVKDGIIELVGLDTERDVFQYANDIMEEFNSDQDYRDNITPMDALIVSDALMDPECVRMYTSDTKLLDIRMIGYVNDIRKDIDRSYSQISFKLHLRII